MAGYGIYSLDWAKFRRLVERPTPAQLAVLAKSLADELEVQVEDGEIDPDDPIRAWPRDPAGLAAVVAERLAMPDWYGDLSEPGKRVWEPAFYAACMSSRRLAVGFRVESDGIYFDIVEFVCRRLGLPPDQTHAAVAAGTPAMARFGMTPFRYHPPARLRYRSSDWTPYHSMHPPDEVGRMRDELRSVAAAVKAEAGKEDRRQFEQELLPAVERVAAAGRLLFVQVDT